jgi:hypothetical protein
MKPFPLRDCATGHRDLAPAPADGFCHKSNSFLPLAGLTPDVTHSSTGHQLHDLQSVLDVKCLGAYRTVRRLVQFQHPR